MKTKHWLMVLLITTLANFLAQVPYLIHQYHGSPSVTGTLLMSAVLLWFLVGFFWIWNNLKKGYILTLSFLVVEFIFYLSTQITQVMSGKGVLLHVLHPDDPVLFIVFGIGYINFVGAGFFIFYLLHYKKSS